MASARADTRSVETSVLRRVRTEDRGDIIGSWLIRLVLGLALAGVVLFDAISIGTAKMSLQDTARGAAREAVDATAVDRDTATAWTAARTYATEQNALNEVDPAALVLAEDGSVTVQVRRTAPTLVVQRVRWIADWAELSESGTAAPLR